MVDKRQFVISNKKLKYKDFDTVSLGCCWICYEKHLQIRKLTDISGNDWIFIGIAYSTENEGNTPVNDVTVSETKDVIEKSFYWAGRWLIINNNSMYTDAAGLMGLYYLENENEWLISTSLHIINEIHPDTCRCLDKKVRVHDQFHSYPAPGSRLTGVRKMFPSQYIKYDEKSIMCQYHDQYRLNRELLTEEKDRQLANAIKSVVSNVALQSEKDVWVALTSGNDSRVLLAALLATNVKFKGYTMAHGNISNGDRQVPKKMSQELNFPYEYIKRKHHTDKKALDSFYEHTFYSIEETDKEFYASGQFDAIGDNCIVLKGGILDLCKGSAYPKFSENIEMLEHLKKVSPKNEEYEKYNRLIAEWFEWIEQHPSNMDIRDRFCLEYHLGGWLANLQQFADMLNGEFVQICNSAYIISLICSYTDEERESRRIYHALYQILYHEVSEYPINPYDRFHMLKYYFNAFKTNPIMCLRKLIKQ
jgi:hypothetical protein